MLVTPPAAWTVRAGHSVPASALHRGLYADVGYAHGPHRRRQAVEELNRPPYTPPYPTLMWWRRARGGRRWRS
jgi:hypothetical protein